MRMRSRGNEFYWPACIAAMRLLLAASAAAQAGLLVSLSAADVRLEEALIERALGAELGYLSGYQARGRDGPDMLQRSRSCGFVTSLLSEIA